MIEVISLGAGVQSTTLALMAAAGEIAPMPTAAIFADTGAEPAAVYKHLRWLMEPGRLPFPVYVVSDGNLAQDIGAARPRGKFKKMPIPAFVGTAKGGMATRSCTQDYKIRPIRRRMRELLGIAGKRSPLEPWARQWLGISTDEASRMTTAREPWIELRYPLIEKMMSRADCLAWIAARGFPTPPKSSCTFCPYHSDDQWRALTPPEMAEAVAIDDKIRDVFAAQRSGGKLYLHRSLRPLREVDFTKPTTLLDLFDEECAGVCGV